MTRAYEALAVDKAVADPAAVVRADVIDDDEHAAAQPRDRDRTGAISRCDHHPRGDIDDLRERRSTVVGVVPELVEDLRADGGHTAQATDEV